MTLRLLLMLSLSLLRLRMQVEPLENMTRRMTVGGFGVAALIVVGGNNRAAKVVDGHCLTEQMMPKWCDTTIISRKVWTEGLFTLKIGGADVQEFKPGQFLHLALNGEENKIRKWSTTTPWCS